MSHSERNGSGFSARYYADATVIFATLELTQFRNITTANLSLGKGFNILVGANAQGKTNVLEALSLFANGRSFREAEIHDMIRLGQREARLQATTESSQGKDHWKIILRDGKKEWTRNGKTSFRRPEPGPSSIIFSPDETRLLKDAPAARRAYLDDVVRLSSPPFAALLRDYERTLAQRNRLLADKTISRVAIAQQLPHWDDHLISWGSRIATARATWIEKLAAHLPRLYAGLAPHDGAALLSYLPFYGAEPCPTEVKVAERFSDLLLKRRDEEMDRRVTLVGPHRDDWEIGLGEGKARRHASQGQHRTLILSLKLAELKLREEETRDRPLLLLDDVTSELDEQRLQRLLDYLGDIKTQIFLTTTERDVFPTSVTNTALLFSLPQLTSTGS